MQIRIHGRRMGYLDRATQLDVWILDALRNIKRVPDGRPDAALEKLIVTIYANQESLPRWLKFAEEEPPRVRALLGAIAELLGVPEDDVNSLKRSLKSTTKYFLGIGSKTLPTAHKWNIY